MGAAFTTPEFFVSASNNRIHFCKSSLTSRIAAWYSHNFATLREDFFTLIGVCRRNSTETPLHYRANEQNMRDELSLSSLESPDRGRPRCRTCELVDGLNFSTASDTSASVRTLSICLFTRVAVRTDPNIRRMPVPDFSATFFLPSESLSDRDSRRFYLARVIGLLNSSRSHRLV